VISTNLLAIMLDVAYLSVALHTVRAAEDQ